MYKTLALLTLLFMACGPKPTPHIPDDTHMCADACENLRALGCQEGEQLEDGSSCESFCVETQDSGHALNPTCVSQIQACSEIESCGELSP